MTTLAKATNTLENWCVAAVANLHLPEQQLLLVRVEGKWAYNKD